MTTQYLENEDHLPSYYTAARRIDSSQFTHAQLEDIVEEQCIGRGKPLVISNMQASSGWDNQIFHFDNLKSLCGTNEIPLIDKEHPFRQVLLGDYLETLVKEFDYEFESRMMTSPRYKGLHFSIHSLYAKDVRCPEEYREALKKIIPGHLMPLGEDDLFSCMPSYLRAENLMCYVGHTNTGTPIHRDICGTMGHNVMVTGSMGAFAEWVIIEDKDRDLLASILRPNNDKESADEETNLKKSSFLESDRAWLSQEDVEKSGITAHVIIQRPGDLVIIPSCAYHQVRNKGVSVKVAWNRTTVTSLAMAFKKQLPLYHIVNRPEVYKCKAMIAATIEHWYQALVNYKTTALEDIPLVQQYGRERFLKDAAILVELFMNVVIVPEEIEEIPEELITKETNEADIVMDKPEDLFSVSCDFCHCDVFHRYFHCEKCHHYDLCMECYARGRCCRHVRNIKMHQSGVALETRIHLYQAFIDIVNMICKYEVLTAVESKQRPSYSLATTCRRIQKQRSQIGRVIHVFTCSHCPKTITLDKLAKAGISLNTLFQRRRCASAVARFSIYTCKECTQKCPSCQQLILKSEDEVDYDLVYYSNPANDPRNWGSSMDYNINLTCHHPQEIKHMKEMPSSVYHKRKDSPEYDEEESPVKKAKSTPRRAGSTRSKIPPPADIERMMTRSKRSREDQVEIDYNEDTLDTSVKTKKTKSTRVTKTAEITNKAKVTKRTKMTSRTKVTMVTKTTTVARAETTRYPLRSRNPAGIASDTDEENTPAVSVDTRSYSDESGSSLSSEQPSSDSQNVFSFDESSLSSASLSSASVSPEVTAPLERPASMPTPPISQGPMTRHKRNSLRSTESEEVVKRRSSV